MPTPRVARKPKATNTMVKLTPDQIEGLSPFVERAMEIEKEVGQLQREYGVCKLAMVSQVRLIAGTDKAKLNLADWTIEKVEG